MNGSKSVSKVTTVVLLSLVLMRMRPSCDHADSILLVVTSSVAFFNNWARRGVNCSVIERLSPFKIRRDVRILFLTLRRVNRTTIGGGRVLWGVEADDDCRALQ